MKLHVLSDLHIEFAPFDFPPVDANVLVLAGDIGTRLQGLKAAQTWARGRPVVYVAGNHEYYRDALPRLTEKLTAAAEGTDVYFLENQVVELNGVRFLGCTLWTDFDLFGESERVRCMLTAQAVMNDYRLIRKSPQYSRLRPLHTRQLHLQSVAWLEEQLQTPFPGPTVVITHHAPTGRSIDGARFSEDRVSAAYASNLERLLNGQAHAALWIHGHTHHCVDYQAGETRVVANQRGYPDEPVRDFDPDRVVEVLT